MYHHSPLIRGLLIDHDTAYACSSEEEAQEAACTAKRGLLSLLGFLSWMLSVVQLKDTKLSAGDQQYLQQLCLDERPRTGAVFDLTRDQHEINFPHWANNRVAFHYVWTELEAKNKRFLRFSPEYSEEVARLRENAKGDDVSVEDLPSYPLWKDDLEGSDWIGQNPLDQVSVLQKTGYPATRGFAKARVS
jgi:hypothetical protein